MLYSYYIISIIYTIISLDNAIADALRSGVRDLCVQVLHFFDEVTTSLFRRSSIIETSLLDCLDYSRELMVYVVT